MTELKTSLQGGPLPPGSDETASGSGPPRPLPLRAGTESTGASGLGGTSESEEGTLPPGLVPRLVPEVESPTVVGPEARSGAATARLPAVGGYAVRAH